MKALQVKWENKGMRAADATANDTRELCTREDLGDNKFGTEKS